MYIGCPEGLKSRPERAAGQLTFYNTLRPEFRNKVKKNSHSMNGSFGINTIPLSYSFLGLVNQNLAPIV
jgi:hypothetical protein